MCVFLTTPFPENVPSFGNFLRSVMLDHCFFLLFSFFWKIVISYRNQISIIKPQHQEFRNTKKLYCIQIEECLRAATVACLDHHRVYNFLSEPKPLSQPLESNTPNLENLGIECPSIHVWGLLNASVYSALEPALICYKFSIMLWSGLRRDKEIRLWGD